MRDAQEMISATKKALAAASIQGRTNEGRRTFQTILTAAAIDGDGPSRVTAKRRAEHLGVHSEHLVGAKKRVRRLRSDLTPSLAMDEGAYWFQPRGKRSDTTPPEVLELMKRFWHTDGISRASGTSSDRDMWRESKRPGAASHSRRQLHVQGGGEAAFSKFFEWPDYINFKRIWKSEKGEDIKDPGRALFLSTRCKCLTTLNENRPVRVQDPHAARLVPEGVARG